MAISGYDITAANNTLTPPNGAPEGMAPSAVNNIQRQQMANDRAQWNTAEWFEYLDGTPNGTVTYVAINLRLQVKTLLLITMLDANLNL
mgnify:CR=1 FL=1